MDLDALKSKHLIAAEVVINNSVEVSSRSTFHICKVENILIVKLLKKIQ